MNDYKNKSEAQIRKEQAEVETKEEAKEAEYEGKAVDEKPDPEDFDRY